jgi:hypothetical protein
MDYPQDLGYADVIDWLYYPVGRFEYFVLQEPPWAECRAQRSAYRPFQFVSAMNGCSNNVLSTYRI